MDCVPMGVERHYSRVGGGYPDLKVQATFTYNARENETQGKCLHGGKNPCAFLDYDDGKISTLQIK